MTRPLLAFYGDDFTGSTDVLLQYHRFGLRGVLVLSPPDPDEARRLAETYDVIGVPGIARSLPTAEIGPAIRPALTALAAPGPWLVQYKICSTADSSPAVGGLGPALAIGRELYGARPVPILAAQPDLGRYTAFAHHFARDGAEVYRLDRQPTMSRHPVTPMTESDLRVHVAAQTDLPVSGIDVRALEDGTAEARYRSLADQGALVLDAMTNDHLRAAARMIDRVRDGRPLFAIGSGGLSYGIAAHLTGRAPDLAPPPVLPPAPTLVVSGSCSALTAAQIRHAAAHGWATVPLEPDAAGALPVAAASARARAAFAAGAPGVVVHTALGAPTRDGGLPPERTGRAFAEIIRACGGVRRVVVAGGDTSGHTVRALGVAALDVAGPIGGNAVICRSLADGRELVLKGGQIGVEELFTTVQQGGSTSPAPLT